MAGRPRIEIDINEIESSVNLGLTWAAKIAEILNVSYKILKRFCEENNFEWESYQRIALQMPLPKFLPTVE